MTEGFEEFEVWQKSRALCNRIYRFTSKEGFRNDYHLCNQIRDSAGSIMYNIAEGYERDGNKEYIQYLSISKGSAGELRSQLYLALDQGYVSESEFKEVVSETKTISKMLSGFIKYLKNNTNKGRKFK